MRSIVSPSEYVLVGIIVVVPSSWTLSCSIVHILQHKWAEGIAESYCEVLSSMK